MNINLIAATTALIGATLGMAPAAQAVTVSKLMPASGGGACQLSVPTTDTKIRPKATGMRNEGTTNAFVICNLLGVRSTGTLTNVYVDFNSFDAATHNFNCTMASSFNTVSVEYLTKPVSVSADSQVTFSAAEMPDGGFRRYNTLTCTLPPGAAINGVQPQFDDDVGT